jgi:hypothetical protein
MTSSRLCLRARWNRSGSSRQCITDRTGDDDGAGQSEEPAPADGVEDRGRFHEPRHALVACEPPQPDTSASSPGWANISLTERTARVETAMAPAERYSPDRATTNVMFVEARRSM